MNEQESFQTPDAKGLFEEVEKHLPPPPEWINFEHPDFPKYFYIAILGENGEVKTWWQRIPEPPSQQISLSKD